MDRVIIIREIRPDVEAKIKTWFPLVWPCWPPLSCTGFYTVDSGEGSGAALWQACGYRGHIQASSGAFRQIDKVWKIKVSGLRRRNSASAPSRKGPMRVMSSAPGVPHAHRDENLINVETIVHRIVDINRMRLS